MFVTPWLMLFWQLSYSWDASPQYSFGWMVPPLFAFVLWKKWQHRPRPSSCPGAASTAQWLAAILLLPIWFLLQPSPDWRLLNWLFATLTLAFSAAVCLRAGGWSWLRHFLPVLLLPLVAVPWPMNLENSTMEVLSRAVTSCAVDLLNLLGTPALQQGNLIAIGSGLLGVDEACSGIRSLQASLMAALFLGELFQTRATGRLLLIACGAALAFLTNLFRATFLGWVTGSDGVHAMEQWHDAAGLAVLTVCLLGVLGIATRLSQQQLPPPDRRPTRVSFTGLGILILWAAGLFLTELWFRSGSTEQHSLVFLPRTGSQSLKVPKQSAEQLLYDKATTASWKLADGSNWAAFFFEWKTGTARSRILARMHKPEACLPASGYKFKSSDPLVSLEIGQFKVPFRAMTFESPAGLMHVFYCLWQTDGSAASDKTIQRTCIDAAWRRERRLGQQVLQVAVLGYPSAAEAAEALKRQLPPMLQVQN